MRVEDRGHGNTVALAYRREDRRHADDIAAVVLDRVDRRESALAGRHGSREDQHMLVGDHRRSIVAEHHLTVADELGREDIDRLVSVQIHEARVGQLLGNKRADDLGAVQTDDCVDHGVGAVERDDLFRDRLRLGHTVFLRCHVDIIIRVAVHGREMSPLHA